MPRWQPDTHDRLVHAALELYSEHGYEATTVGDIAAHVGVTARTYFRYFPDKREVLFSSGERLRAAILSGTEHALSSQTPYAAVLAGIASSFSVFETRDFVRDRELVIAASAELREREAMKTASIADDLAALLTSAAVDEVEARMIAAAAVSVLDASIHRWQNGDETPFTQIVSETAERLHDATRPRP